MFWRAHAVKCTAPVRQKSGVGVDAPVDVAVECSGAGPAIAAALAVTGAGGTTALVGIPPGGAQAAVDVNALLRNRRVVGSLNGTVDVPRDFPVIIEHARRGELELTAQVSRVWPLAEIDDALVAVRAGHVVRAVLDHT
jgi:Zn-dependent alcohol dehydrogenase